MRHGSLDAETPILADRATTFWSRVRKTATCWEWTGVTTNGYGKVNWKDMEQWAHRLAYRLLVGAIPEGLTLDHLCRNRACVNPAHLEPVTQAENVRRALVARKGAIA